MVSCAVYAWGGILEHVWSETCKDGDQFDMEPNIKDFLVETWETRTDDDKGSVHDTVSHNRLELWDLGKYDMEGFKHHRCFML